MGELFSKLGIEWSTLIAQMVNFGVLFIVLSKFVYKPIVNVLEKRRSQVLAEKEKSDKLNAALAHINEERNGVLAKARLESEVLIKQAEKLGKEQAEKIILEGHKEAERIIRDGEKTADLEREKMTQEVKQDIGELVGLAVEKAVGKAFDQRESSRLIEEAVSIIRNTEPKR